MTDYVGSSIEPKAVLDKLDFIGIRGAPGYVGTMGRGAAADMADKALEEEHQAWGQMDFFGRSFIDNSPLLQCPRQLHIQRLAFFQHITSIPSGGLIEIADARLMIAEGKELSLLQLRCSNLALTAKDWRAHIVSRFSEPKA